VLRGDRRDFVAPQPINLGNTMTASLFAAVEMAPRDPILGLTESFNADTRPPRSTSALACILTTAARCLCWRPSNWPRRLVWKRHAGARLSADRRSCRYNQIVQKLLFGADSALLEAGRVLTIEALGGTGALKVGADYLRRLLPDATVYISDPSWENHRAMFENAGFEVETYPYYDAATRGVDFAAMKAGLNACRRVRSSSCMPAATIRPAPTSTRRNGAKSSTRLGARGCWPSSTWPIRALPTASAKTRGAAIVCCFRPAVPGGELVFEVVLALRRACRRPVGGHRQSR
jgi:hypothetical protein